MTEPEKSDQAASTAPPRGPVSFVRRRLLPWAGKLWAMLGVLILAAWLTGRILTDEHLWSQYLFWAPTLWVVAAAFTCCVLSWLSGLLATRMSGDLIRPMLAVFAVLMLVTYVPAVPMALVEYFYR